MLIDSLPAKDREELESILQDMVAQGAQNPLIPMDVDSDGNGIVDAWGLNSFGKLTLVSGVKLENTVYRSTGETND